MNKGTSSNNVKLGTNLFIAVLGTAVIAQTDYEMFEESIPSMSVRYEQFSENSIFDTDYHLNSSQEIEKLNVIQSFSGIF